MQEFLLSSFNTLETLILPYLRLRQRTNGPLCVELRKVNHCLRQGRSSVFSFVIGLVVALGLAPTFAGAQTAPYRLHKEASTVNTSFNELLTAGPDAGSVALTSSLTGKTAGEYVIKEFETQTGTPNAAGVIPSGSTLSFSLWMRKTASVGTVFPRAKIRLNTASGTLLCTATGTTALTTTVAKQNLSCTTSANVTMAATDRFYLWVGVNLTATSSSSFSGEADIEGTANGNFDSQITVPLATGAPAISSLTPNAGAVGSSVVIAGTNFRSTQGNSAVTFNGTAATVSNWTATSITTAVPVGATSGPVGVTVGGQASVGSSFTVLPPPGISGLSPNSGVAGTSVTITGANFGAVQGSVTFNGTAAAISSWSDKTIVTHLPAGATTGNVVVTTGSGAQSAGARFTVFNPGSGVMITSLSAIAGAPGSALTISGVNFGATQGTSSTVTFNGTAATVTSWSAGSIVATVPNGATTGNVVVTVGGQASNGLRFIVTNAAGLAVDQIVTGRAAAPPALSTTTGNQLLLAYVASGTGSSTTNSVTVGGLTWTLVKRTNTQKGTAEIWRAFTPFILTNYAAPAGTVFPSHTLVTIVSYLGVDTTGTNGSGAIGAVGTANAATGAPAVTLTSTQGNSFVFGVGDDPSAATARTLGTNQTMVDQFLDGSADTLWVQRMTGSIANSGTSVTLNDTAPTNHPYNLSAVEVLPSPVPVITGLSPSVGPIGTVVTISGTNFGATQGASTVTFGGVAATPTWGSTSIVAAVPNGVPLGAVPVIVTTATGASNAATFTVSAPLAITTTLSSQFPLTNNWYRSDVTITYQCSGGVAPLQCPTQQTITTEGLDQQIVGTVTDAAGQKTSITTHLNIDKTPPTITASVTPAPVNGIVTIPAGGAVIVSFTCTDALSGLASCPQAVSIATPGANQSFSGTAIDLAANSSASANITLNVQAVPLAINASPSAQPNGNSWYKSNVTINYQCSGGVPPLQCPTSRTISTEGLDQQITGTVSDATGQKASVTTHLNIDKTPPTITASVTPAPVNGIVTIPASGAVVVSFTCADSLSGLASCPQAISITTPGANQSLTGTATDVAGNSSAPANVTLNVQAGPLVISASVSPPPNAKGWNRTDTSSALNFQLVIVSFNCSGGVPPLQCPLGHSVTDGANQQFTGTVTDSAGQTATISTTVNVDGTPPAITASISPPPNARNWNKTDVVVSFNCSDPLSGVASCPPSQTVTTEGAYQVVQGVASDNADNSATASIAVNIEKTGPIIQAVVSPSANAQGWNNSDVVVKFQCTSGIAGGVHCPSSRVLTAEAAQQNVVGTISDVADNASTASVSINIDKTPPAVSISSPVNGAIVSTSSLSVTGSVGDALSGVAAVTCNGSPATITNASFACTLTLSPGTNTIAVLATDVAGNSSPATLSVDYVIPGPKVSITSPSALALFSANPITITGIIDDLQATVLSNGVTGAVSGNTFTISGVNLRESKNLLTVVASNTAGGTSAATVTVFLDTTPPQVHIDSPGDGAVVNTSQVVVMGNVNDLVSGTVNGDQVSVSVNGVNATVSNRSFTAQNILLVPGQNTITAIAKDRAGNVSQHQIRVTFRDATTAQYLVIVSGNNQSGVINTVLPQPLVVQAVDGLGRPIVNRALTFQVSRSDGTMAAAVQSGRNPTVVTDGNGQASVKFRLGSRSGVGINQVAVTAPGFVGDTIFYVTSTVAAPTLIHTVSGEVQKGAVEFPLAEPLVVIVMDSGGNPVANVPVTFQVGSGNGLIGGGTSAVETTDGDGKAFAVLTLGQQPGTNNNTVSATFTGNAGLPAQFVASGVITGTAATTTISGVVLDNASQPIPNARASVKGSQTFALTNAQGQFTIPGAPVGDVMLYVDGTFSTRPERFPTLSFQLTALPGIDNALPGPIYLPAIDSGNTQMIDNNSDQDVILTVKGMPGVQYKVFAHSATFPDGSKSGSLSLSQVHVDRVPMTPANGTAPSFVTTLQPPGVSFDPPVQMQVPNTSGLLPGQVAEIFSYRHDLEQFVSEGTGRVSEDGSVITTDPGFGLRVSGWNLIPPPPVVPNTTCNCPGSPTSTSAMARSGLHARDNAGLHLVSATVEKTTAFDRGIGPGNNRPAPSGQGLSSSTQRTTQPGIKTPAPPLAPPVPPCPPPACDLGIRVLADNNPDVDAQLVNQNVQFHADPTGSCAGDKTWDWDFGDSSAHGSGDSPTHPYKTATTTTPYQVVVTLTCKDNPPDCQTVSTKDKPLQLTIFTVRVKDVSWAGVGINQMFKTGNGKWSDDKFGDEGNQQIDAPQWTSQDGTVQNNDPISYVVKSTPQVAADFEVTPPIPNNLSVFAQVKIEDSGTKNGLQFPIVPKVQLNYDSGSISMTTAAQAFGDVVDHLSINLKWSISVDNGSTFHPMDLSPTVHDIFVTLKQPLGYDLNQYMTAVRVQRAVDVAKGLKDNSAIAHAIDDNLFNDNILGFNLNIGEPPNGTRNHWKHLDLPPVAQDPVHGGLDCIGLANLAAKHLKLLGIYSAQPSTAWPTGGNGPQDTKTDRGTSELDSQGRPLLFYDGGANLFEGFYEINDNGVRKAFIVAPPHDSILEFQGGPLAGDKLNYNVLKTYYDGARLSGVPHTGRQYWWVLPDPVNHVAGHFDFSVEVPFPVPTAPHP